jgi:hypothetical protein
VCALKFTLGIFNRTTRDKEYAWRTLGYESHFVKEDTTGQEMFVETGHMDVDLAFFDSSDEEDSDDDDDDVSCLGIDHYMEAAEDDSSLDDEATAGCPLKKKVMSDDLSSAAPSVETAVKAQDLHTQLSTILNKSGFKDITRTGFKWDLCYKGKVYPVTFILFVPFIKGDTEEHDKHCGKYLSRTEKVAQLCRYCQCPTAETDNPSANYPPKTQELIENLVDEHDLEGLQQLSQHYMRNAWYEIFFGTHNKMGVHGGTPSEMLHALLLGLYKYCRAIFFFYIGPESQAAETINAIAKQYGKFFKHQSD